MNHEHSLDPGHADPPAPPVAPPAADSAVNGSLNGTNKPNGDLKHDPSSPAADSPATPVSSAAAPDVKIDIDYQEQESDVRHEPMPVKAVSAVDNKPFVSTDSDAPHIHSPSHPDDVKMADQSVIPNGVHHINDDVHMEDGSTPPATSPIVDDSSMASVQTGQSTPRQHTFEEDGDDKPPPAKRARITSDVGGSFNHVNSATPPPASAAPSPVPPPTASSIAPPPSSIPPSTAPPLSSGSSTGAPITNAQLRFCQSTIRSLKKLKDSSPFLRPVDHIALNIPHYYSIITHPMDFATIERKLASSNAAKPDPNLSNPRYHTADEFVADVRQIFQNCMTFNGPDHAITAMGRRVEEIFDKQIKQLPPAMPQVEVKPAPPPKKATPPPPPLPISAPPKHKAPPPPRRLSTTVPVIRRSDNEAVGRPKREIHPPPPKDLPYSDAPKKSRKGKRVKDDGTGEQMKFCGKLLQDLHRKQHWQFANPFYEPVDWQKMDLPMYPKVVKKPMDLSTMRRKLDAGEYLNAQSFYADFKLMVKNCFAFNPVGTPVQVAGAELQRLFEDKWKNLPPLRDISDSDDDEEESEEEEARLRKIAELEAQMENMRETLATLKNRPVQKKKKEERREKVPVASTSKAPPKPQKSQPSKKKTKKPIADDDVLTFEQKKDLSESISKLDDAKLEKVIQIIHEGVPEIRDSTEEIELEIDTLPAAVLTKLYNFVIRPLRAQPGNKRNRTGKGTGTGGLKRKSMDEDVEAEKIRQLEKRMALFDQPLGGGTSAATRNVDSDHSSDSSDSDSSASDSE